VQKLKTAKNKFLAFWNKQTFIKMKKKTRHEKEKERKRKTG